MPVEQDTDSSLHATMIALQRRVQGLEAMAAEHERIRQQLREEHSFREAVIERAAEGISVCHAIPEYPFVQFTVWNQRMKDMTGYSMEEINRLGWYQSMYPDPEIQERARQRMAQMREGEDLRGERWEITRADKEKRTLGISTSILKTDDGQIHVLALMQDITNEEKYRARLETKVLRLEGLLPICASCKKTRDDDGIWHRLEVYMRERSEVDFTHCICPDCKKELYPSLKK